ncbi:MAG: sugar ABC transporter ATP-binding protein [Anaerolineae bacterium]|nr:sugar ABC transporter ATP-binding protein [Anaerolineae bacterium]
MDSNAVTTPDAPTPTDAAAVPERPIVLQMQAITKRFPGVTALDNVSFDVHKGEVHCLVGENGAGKSTLMKVMNGIYTEYEGQILLEGRTIRLHSTREAQLNGIGMIHQELNLIPELRVYENIFLGREIHTRVQTLDRRRMHQESITWLKRLGVNIDPSRPVRELRIGERQLVEIAKALSLNARILVMDEPTSALTDAETKRLFSVILSLKAAGVAIVYISHRMDEIFSIADRITVLRDGKTVASLMASAVTRPQLIRYMVGRSINEAFSRQPNEADKVVLEVRNLSLNHPGIRTINNVSFELKRGEVIGLAGLMGAGRTETLETIFGVYPLKHRSGQVVFKGQPTTIHDPADAIRQGIGYVTEDRKGKSLISGLPVRINSTLAALRLFAQALNVINRKQEFQAVNDQVKNLDIRTPTIETLVANLSGGNQQKVVLAKFLLTKPDVLLLDEPTRGIDVGAKSQIYQLVDELARQGCAFIIASSEMPELLAVCDRILVLCEGRITGEFTHVEATQEKILDAATRFLQTAPAS